MTITIPAGRTIPLGADPNGFASLTIARGAGNSSGAGVYLRLTDSAITATANPLPAAMDTMEYPEVAVGQTPPEGAEAGALWGGLSVNFSDGFVVDDQITLPGRSRALRAIGKKTKASEPVLHPGGPGWSTQGLYHTHWIRFDESTLTQPNPGGSHKILRCLDDPDGQHIRTALETTEQTWLYVDHAGPGTILALYPDREVWEDFPAQWHRVEQWISVEGDGPVKVWFDGKLAMSGTGCVRSVDDTGQGFRTGLIGYDINIRDYVSDTNLHSMNDYYAGPTLERIELSNESTYNDLVYQKRYYQYCTRRVNGEIDFLFEPHDLDTDAPMYAWVYGPDGMPEIIQISIGVNAVEIL